MCVARTGTLSKPRSTSSERWVGGAANSQGRVPPGQLLDGDAGLQPGQRGAEAVVHAEREGQVPAGIGPVNPEPVGLVEDPRLAVGAADGQEDGPARRDHAAADLDVLGGCPGGQLEVSFPEAN
jgi:hypothetical protein